MLGDITEFCINRAASRHGLPTRIEYTAYDMSYKVRIGNMLFTAEHNFNTKEINIPVYLIHGENILRNAFALNSYISKILNGAKHSV